MTHASPSVARPAVLADAIPGHVVRDVALVLGGAGLVGLAAQVSVTIPGISPVAFTLQTMAVLLVGAALGSLRGLASLGLYLAAGSAGVPWFAKGESGLGGPTFGYVIGFVVAAFVVGRIAESGVTRNALRTFAVMVLGTALVYAVGVPWLALASSLSAAESVEKGMGVFLLTDALKALLAAGLLPTAWLLLGRARD